MALRLRVPHFKRCARLGNADVRRTVVGRVGRGRAQQSLAQWAEAGVLRAQFEEGAVETLPVASARPALRPEFVGLISNDGSLASMARTTIADIFIVHLAADAGAASMLSRALHECKMRVFSRDSLKAGDSWGEVVHARLIESRAIVVLISRHWPRAGTSSDDWAAPEEIAIATRLAKASGTRRRVIPVWLDGSSDRTPYGLNRVTGVSISGPRGFDDAAVSIVAAIEPTPAEPIPALRDLEVAQARLKTLHSVGADSTAIRLGQQRVLNAKRRARDGRLLFEGETFARRYVLMRILGSGGYASVWLARDRHLNEREVALKILHARWSRDQTKIDRFKRGAERMSALSHPSVVEVLSQVALFEGWYYYAMEYVAGGDLLTARTRAEAPLPPQRALWAIMVVAEAVAEAHSRRWVHRDLKPHNILLTELGAAKVTDFDLVGAQDTTGGTRTGAVGTFIYAAPEAMLQGKDATPAADVYSLGVCSVFALLGRVSKDLIRDEAKVVKGIETTEPVKRLLLRALSWEPDDRHRDAGEFARELRAALLAPENSRKRLWQFVLAIALAVAIVTLAVAVAIHSSAGVDEENQESANWTLDASASIPLDVSTVADQSSEELDAMTLEPVILEVGGANYWDAGTSHDTEGMAHSVIDYPLISIDGGLLVGRTEVTERLWTSVMKPNSRSSTAHGLPHRPMIRVTYQEALRFANLYSLREGLEPCYSCDADVCSITTLRPHCNGYRLPTLVEWARIVQADSKNPTPAMSRAVVGVSGKRKKAHPVCSRELDDTRLCDVFGNVWEWVWDGGATSTRYRKRCGGAFFHTWREAQVCYDSDMAARKYWQGVRLVRSDLHQ